MTVIPTEPASYHAFLIFLKTLDNMSKVKPTPYLYAPTKDGRKLPWELGRPDDRTVTEEEAVSDTSSVSEPELESNELEMELETGAASGVQHKQYRMDSDSDSDNDNCLPGDTFRSVQIRRAAQASIVSHDNADNTNNSQANPRSRCRCLNCIEMPLNIENKCCCEEDLNITHLSDFIEGVCIINCEEIQHVIGKVNVRCAWMRQRRYFGHCGPALAFTNMDNRAYRYHAYRCYIDYMHGLLGRYNRKVIPSCIVKHIRETWPDPDDNYRGFVMVDEDGVELPMDELAEL